MSQECIKTLIYTLCENLRQGHAIKQRCLQIKDSETFLNKKILYSAVNSNKVITVSILRDKSVLGLSMLHEKPPLKCHEDAV